MAFTVLFIVVLFIVVSFFIVMSLFVVRFLFIMMIFFMNNFYNSFVRFGKSFKIIFITGRSSKITKLIALSLGK